MGWWCCNWSPVSQLVQWWNLVKCLANSTEIRYLFMGWRHCLSWCLHVVFFNRPALLHFDLPQGGAIPLPLQEARLCGKCGKSGGWSAEYPSRKSEVSSFTGSHDYINTYMWHVCLRFANWSGHIVDSIVWADMVCVSDYDYACY